MTKTEIIRKIQELTEEVIKHVELGDTKKSLKVLNVAGHLQYASKGLEGVILETADNETPDKSLPYPPNSIEGIKN